ncbi:MAG: hypothetical protein EHM40_14000 [Chloroflexi bacterium]|nr:MAG: hypothetical protein EHM40_14000 [Chloroflexota bacterium]
MEQQTRVNSLQAIQSGLERFVRYPQILLSAYVLNLLSALLLVLVPALLLVRPAHYTVIQTAADGIDTWLVTELLMSTTTYPTLQDSAEPLQPGWLSQSLLVITGILLIMPLFAWLPASFLAGGTLLTYVEAPPAFSWQRFLWGCWHWFGAFLLINLILGIVTQILVGALLVGMAAASSAAGSAINWITIPFAALVITLWLIVLEYTRLLAVHNRTRNMFKAFGSAVALVIHRPLVLLGFYALSLLILLLIQALFRALLLSEFVSWGLLFLIVSQIFIMARLSMRLIRWAGAVAIQPKHASAE